MKLVKLLPIGLTLTLSTGAFANLKIIYGEDNRQDIYQTSNKMYLEVAQATAGMVKKSTLLKNGDGTYKIQGFPSIGEGMSLCKDQKFYDQPLLANCSGFLIADNILVTAGHCLKSRVNCGEENKWVFGLGMKSSTKMNKSNVSYDNVYECRKVLAWKNPQTDPNREDYAVIQLDRRVKNRKPLQYRVSGKVAQKTNLTVIGHPTMLPTKITDGGYIQQGGNSNPYQFTTTLDTFGGNSGSVVFDSNTGLVEGILVSGKQDYVLNQEKGCKEVNHCKIDPITKKAYDCKFDRLTGQKDPADGENVTRITTAIKDIRL